MHGPRHLHAMLHGLNWLFTLYSHNIPGNALELVSGTQVASTTLGLATIVDGQLTGLGIVPVRRNPLG